MRRQFKRGSAFERALQLAREKQRNAAAEARKAQAIEAHRAATVKQGAVADESAVAESDAPKGAAR